MAPFCVWNTQVHIVLWFEFCHFCVPRANLYVWMLDNIQSLMWFYDWVNASLIQISMRLSGKSVCARQWLLSSLFAVLFSLGNSIESDCDKWQLASFCVWNRDSHCFMIWVWPFLKWLLGSMLNKETVSSNVCSFLGQMPHYTQV